MGLSVHAKSDAAIAPQSYSVCVGLLMLLCLLFMGCQQPMQTPTRLIETADFGKARIELRRNMAKSPSDRMYLLDRFRVAALTLADGYPESSQLLFEEIYEVLRTQGINRDRTVASVIINEDLKIWKGEPFEQALAMVYYGFQQASLGYWDNTRAAANNSLFYLKDFGEDSRGRRLTTEQIAERAASEDASQGRLIDTRTIAERSRMYEQAQLGGGVQLGPAPSTQAIPDDLPQSEYLDHGYVVRQSDFTLGYLLHGIASQQLGRYDEANDYFNAAVAFNSPLQEVVEAFRAGAYNTVLVVSWGLGPEKQTYGPDQSLTRFRPRFSSDSARLHVSVNNDAGRRYPLALDVNRMAADHMWNNMENVRLAKSIIGDVLVVGGLVAAGIGADQGSWEVAAAGLGAAAIGALLKAGAHADKRYMDVLPQRYYVLPLNLGSGDVVQLQVDGKPGSRLVLAGWDRPSWQQAQFRYIRLPSMAESSPAWARSGEVMYGNPQTGSLPASSNDPLVRLPYLLNGFDVQVPTYEVVEQYHQAGLPRTITQSQINEWYRMLRVRYTIEDQGGYAGMHLLEGGRSLVAPLPGTAGFARLFGKQHRAFQTNESELHKQLQNVKQKMFDH